MLPSISGNIALVVKLVLLAEAQRRFEAEDAWWRDHRDHADLFADEFAHVLDQIRELPGRGQRYRVARGKLILRILMPRCACHVYYFHDREHDLVEIHSVWGAARERGPNL